MAKVIFTLRNSKGEDIIWATDDGIWHTPFGSSSGGGGDIPPDVMVKSVYDTDDSGVVDLAEGLVREAKIHWDQILDAPSLSVNWNDIIDIPDDLVHQPDLDIVINNIDTQFTIQEGKITSKVSHQEYQAKITEIEGDLDSLREDKYAFYSVIDKYASQRTVSQGDSSDPIIDTWFAEGVPSMSSFPTTSWSTTEDREAHLGDFYINTTTDLVYVFQKNVNTGVYSWVVTSHNDLTEVLVNAKSTVDVKSNQHRRVFRLYDGGVRSPGKFYIGDLWMKQDGRLMVAISDGEDVTSNDDNFWVPSSAYDPSEMEKLLDQALGEVSAVYDMSNVLDTSWIWNIRANSPISIEATDLYKHSAYVVSPTTDPQSVVLESSTPFTGVTDRVLRLNTDEGSTTRLRNGVTFAYKDGVESKINLSNSSIHRFSVWVRPSSVEQFEVKVGVYDDNGTLDETDLVNNTRVVNYSNAGSGEWILVVMYIVKTTDDLNNDKYKTKIYTTNGLNVSSTESDLRPLKINQDAIDLSVGSRLTNNSEFVHYSYSYRVDMIDATGVLYPTEEELVTNRVRRSGVVEELRSRVNYIESTTTPEAITNTIVQSDAFVSKLPIITTLSKSQFTMTTKVHTTTTPSTIDSIIDQSGFKVNEDLPVLSPYTKVVTNVRYMTVYGTYSDRVLVSSKRDEVGVASKIVVDNYSEVSIESSDNSLSTIEGVTRVDKNYSGAVSLAISSTWDEDVYTPGVISSTSSDGSIILVSITYELSNGVLIELQFSHSLEVVVTSYNISNTMYLPYNYTLLSNDNEIQMINLITEEGTAFYNESDSSDELDISQVTPSYVSVDTYLSNVTIDDWMIRFGSEEWLSLDPKKFYEGTAGIAMSKDTSQVMPQTTESGRNLILQENERPWADASNAIGQNANWRSIYAKVNPNETYSLSRQRMSNRFRYYWLDSIPEIGLPLLGLANNHDNDFKVEGITSKEDTEYIFIYYSNQGEENPLIKLEKGNVASDWTPAPEDPPYEASEVRSLSLTPPLLRLTPDQVTNPSWTESDYNPASPLSRYSRWTIRVISSVGSSTYVTINYSTEITDAIKSLQNRAFTTESTIDGITGTLTNVVSTMDGVEETLSTYQQYIRFDGALWLGELIDGEAQSEIAVKPNVVEFYSYTTTDVQYTPPPGVIAYIHNRRLVISTAEVDSLYLRTHYIVDITTETSPGSGIVKSYLAMKPRSK